MLPEATQLCFHSESTMDSSSTFLVADNISFNNICDSGASHCTFHSPSFFPHGFQHPTTKIHLGGIANSLPIIGVGTTIILVHTHHSCTLQIHIPSSLYVPNLPCNLILPQRLITILQKQNKKSSFHIFPNGCLLLINHHIVPLCYPPTSNLPIFNLLPTITNQAMLSHLLHTSLSKTSTQLLFGFEAVLSNPMHFMMTPDKYTNLTGLQQQLYTWHIQLGHMNFAFIQSMARISEYH